MSSPPKEKMETKAGHPPAVKAGGMRIVQKHQSEQVPDKKDDKDSKEYETESSKTRDAPIYQPQYLHTFPTMGHQQILLKADDQGRLHPANQKAHQRCLLWSQELSLRVIKTSPLLLLRWPIKNLFLQCRSCLQPITSTSTSISPASELSPCPRITPGTPHGDRTTPPETPAQVARDLMPSSIQNPIPYESVPGNVFSTSIISNSPFSISNHRNTKFVRLHLQITNQKRVNSKGPRESWSCFYFNYVLHK